MEERDLRVVISGGGTGGHIFPAIAIANAIKKKYPYAEILFVGAKGKMEMKKVPEAGYEIIGLDISGFNRKNIFKNFSVLWKLRKSLRLAKKILKDFNPDVAVGVGGYASGPTLEIAASLKIPTLIQEQNSYAGVTNKLLGKKVDKICVAYEGMEKFFPREKIVMTGNPCRQDLFSSAVSREEAYKYFELDPKKKTLLVVGGSLGSRTINRSIIQHINEFSEAGIQVIWQCGELYYFDFKLELSNRLRGGTVRLYDFISRMDLAYKAADLVVSRAGASSISELSILKKPAVLLPSPNVAEDHQTKNAMALVEKGAGILVRDADAEPTLFEVVKGLIHDDRKLADLSENIGKLAQLNSAERIVDEVEKLIKR